jgi:hypothetical protein
LKALTEQIDVQTPEVIVPWDERLGDVSRFRADFPGVKFVAVKGRRTYAELRAIGVKQAHGKIVAITEDHCTPNVDWCVQILGAHARPHAAIGGAVEKQAPDTALNWALYLADYLRYMDPVPEGPAQSLTDCNVSYKRAALEAITEIWSNEFHEPSVHGALRARGDSLWLSPGIVVRQQRSVSLGGAVRDRYAFGRLFGSTRVARMPAPQRLFYLAGSLLLPPLLVGRATRQVLRKGRFRREFLRALPALILLAAVWSAGEFLGYLTGRPEPSLTPVLEPAKSHSETGQQSTQ